MLELEQMGIEIEAAKDELEEMRDSL